MVCTVDSSHFPNKRKRPANSSSDENAVKKKKLNETNNKSKSPYTQEQKEKLGSLSKEEQKKNPVYKMQYVFLFTSKL